MLPSSLAILVCLAASLLAQPAVGLSYSVCDTILEEYTTAAPRLEGTWPYYSLLYTCSGNLNLEGFDVDACVENGAKCGQAAADAFCQYLGFDYNAAELYSTTVATAPAISLTGEWCVSPGSYEEFGHPNRTQFDAIKAANPGPYCSSLSSVTCIRSRDSLSKAVPIIIENAANSPAPAPQSTIPGVISLPNPATSSAGRRMKTL